jgi:hypothetical protein
MPKCPDSKVARVLASDGEMIRGTNRGNPRRNHRNKHYAVVALFAAKGVSQEVSREACEMGLGLRRAPIYTR